MNVPDIITATIRENIRLSDRLKELHIELYGDIVEDAKHVNQFNEEIQGLIELYESFLVVRVA